MPDATQTTTAKLSHEEFDAMIGTLASQGRVMAPQRFDKRGRFSDTDLIGYGEVSSASEIEYEVKSDFSPKEVLFPPLQTLLLFNESRFTEASEDERPAYVFLRACDINGIDRLDEIFLRNGPEPDAYYERRRQRVKFILIECATSMENCFCVSMNANRTDDYAMAVRWGEDGVEVLARDKTLADLLPTTARPSDFAPTFPTKDDKPVQVPDIEKLTQAVQEKELFDHEMWEEYARRCIACGRCNTHCVTCSCFTAYDTSYEENPKQGERRRVWAACHIDRFTDMAGGHHFREDYGSRMRFKAMHKIYDFGQRFGRHMCVGCGRCDDQCPEYISFSTCINRITEAVNEDE
jgi:anaerobic sulfite reductase subunit A